MIGNEQISLHSKRKIVLVVFEKVIVQIFQKVIIKAHVAQDTAVFKQLIDIAASHHNIRKIVPNAALSCTTALFGLFYLVLGDLFGFFNILTEHFAFSDLLRLAERKSFLRTLDNP